MALARTWEFVTAQIQIGDVIQSWSSYRSRKPTSFRIEAVLEASIDIILQSNYERIRVSRAAFDNVAPYYSDYAGALLTPTEYNLVKNLTGVMSYIVSLIHHAELISQDNGILNAKLVQMLRAMEQREAASGKVQQSTAPHRKVDITLEDLHMLWVEANGTCSLCGGSIPLETSNRLLQMSPGRVDNSNDVYSRENTRLTHLACNLGRNSASLSEFVQWITCVRTSSLQH